MDVKSKRRFVTENGDTGRTWSLQL
ncbi:hypothetical protein TorRG33x02_096300 [Trema orientale]|uniref:Uncharacterized protein n=1 Tax=Trema orientale TaxID=63057 RepID=A0A2P5F9Y4_TREOI|nr:hypothetical protein TorRG33x02_096300 [Trema orientale]